MRFVRNWLTGKLEEKPTEQGGRQLIYREPTKNIQYPKSQRTNPWSRGKDFVSRGMSLQPEQATPERIERENAEAKRHGTGAYFTQDGKCHMPTNGSRSREMRRQGKMDNDAGYSQWAGR